MLALPQLAWGLCAPEVNGIFPASGIVGTVVAATVRGHGLAGGTVSVFGEPGLDAAATSSSDTALNVQLTIAPGATLGERILVIETPGGIAGASFTVPVIRASAVTGFGMLAFPVELIPPSARASSMFAATA